MLFVLVSVFVLSGCEGIDLSQVSDEDLERLTDKAIVCKEPYMRFETGCCLDKDNNSICDRDESSQELPDLGDNLDKEDIYGEFYEKYHDKFEEKDEKELEKIEEKAKVTLREAEKEIQKAFEAMTEVQREKDDVEEDELFDARSFYFDAKDSFSKALRLFDENKFEDSIGIARKAMRSARNSREVARFGWEEYNKDRSEAEEEIKEDAEDELEDAEDLIEDALDRIEDSEEEGNDVNSSVQMVEEAKRKFREAKKAFYEERFQDAMDMARGVRDIAKRVINQEREMNFDDDEENESEDMDDDDIDEDETLEDGSKEDNSSLSLNTTDENLG